MPTPTTNRTGTSASSPRIPTTWGSGLGVDLIAHQLRVADDEHLPAYLESSNPANLARYRKLGFEPQDEFPLADDGPVVTTMWRPAR